MPTPLALSRARIRQQLNLNPPGFSPRTQGRKRPSGEKRPPWTFREFIRRANPRYQFYRHVDSLIDICQQVADDKLKRVMVFMPPRHGKSELVSRLFAAYYLYRHPDRWVGSTSYAADLAYTLSRAARDHYQRGGGTLRDDAFAVKHWETGQGGGYWAAGVGGPITGKGFHLGIIDDPLKNSEEASSETMREKHKQWYASTFSTREEPGGAIIVIQTRWHQEDLSGWLLSQEEDEPEGWHVVNFPAIREEQEQEFPTSCKVERDTRQPGEPLCPERYSLAKLLKICRRIGSYFWASLYQQRPSPSEGNIFKRHWFRFWVPKGVTLPPVRVQLADNTWHECPQVALPDSFDEQIQSWDMSFKDKKTSDFVAGQVWGRKEADKFLLDQSHERLDLPGTIKRVKDMTAKWPNASAKLVEDKANGPAVIQSLNKEIAGLIAIEPEGTKESRAHGTSPQIESGNVYLPHPAIAGWIDDAIHEFVSFPNAAHDDRVDAMTQALSRLGRGSSLMWGFG